MYSGPKSIQENLIFGYDTGYTHDGLNLSMNRFYKGPSGPNKIEVLNHSRSNTSGTNGFVSNGEEVVDIPKIGKRSVKFVEYFNNYSNSGDLGCCPNLFYYHDGYITGIESSTSYTYSIIYKHTNNYTHPNFMYRYEHNSSGTYLTEQGVHSTASDRRTHLGNGWYHAWGSFTTQSTTAQLRCYSFLYNYGTTKYKFYVAAVSIVKNVSGSTHMIVPPQLMLSPNTTISSTNSLIDVTRSKNIDVSNISFDSTAHPDFDGSNDTIDMGGFDIQNRDYSVEVVYKTDSQYTGQGIITDYQYSWWMMWIDGNNKINWRHKKTDANNFLLQSANEVGGGYHHLVFAFKLGTGAKMYIDGALSASNTFTDGFGLASPRGPRYVGHLRTGAPGSPGSYFNGKIPVVKIYQKTLSENEAKQNFLAYSRRFNI